LISPQDGLALQDCEIAAAKRWIVRHADLFARSGVTLLGDDLYSRQPMCELAALHGFHYIFVCLPESDSALYEWLKYLDANQEVKYLQAPATSWT
jgi:hypothetical protein